MNPSLPPYVSDVSCVHCGATADYSCGARTCARCGDADGILEFQFDLERVRNAWRDAPLQHRSHSHWRYIELLPLDPNTAPTTWHVGWTPLIDAPRLAAMMGVKQLYVKDEGRNPTASLKDRASSVGVAHAMEHGATTIACASTGNAATSLAGHAALAGMRAMIFVPEKTATPKLAQLLAYGATVFAVEGPYENAYQLCSEACAELGWCNRNCAINPVLVEGKKTCGLELAEQFQELGGVPDWVVVSVGDGCTIAGIWKGLEEMLTIGQIDRLPKLLGVQAAGVAPVAYAFKHGAPPSTGDASTLADGINVQTPRNWRKAVRAMRASGGKFVEVTDEQIIAAIAIAGRFGFFGEPAAAASIAGLIEAIATNIVHADERVAVVLTGSGLKDTDAAMRAAGRPIPIAPKLQNVIAVLDQLNERQI